MTDRQRLLKLVAEHIEVDAGQESFENRLILQKAIYLVQAKDINLGYSFSWYLHGPYCKELTYDAYASKDEATIGYVLGDRTKERLQSVLPLINELRKGSIEEAKCSFERAASVLFAIRTNQASADDIEQITKLMNDAGKTYNTAEIRSTVDLLKNYDLLPS